MIIVIETRFLARSIILSYFKLFLPPFLSQPLQQNDLGAHEISKYLYALSHRIHGRHGAIGPQASECPLLVGKPLGQVVLPSLIQYSLLALFRSSTCRFVFTLPQASGSRQSLHASGPTDESLALPTKRVTAINSYHRKRARG